MARQNNGILSIGLALTVTVAAVWVAVTPTAAQQQVKTKPTADDGKRRPVYVSWFGPDSRITRPEQALVRDSAAWEQLWRRHIGLTAKNERGRDPIPLVDFDQCAVVAFFEGQSFNSEGFYVESLTEQPDQWLMRIDEHTYQTSGPDGGGVNVAPFGLFVIPRSVKPLVVERNVQDLIGKPPIWKQVARYDGGK